MWWLIIGMGLLVLVLFLVSQEDDDDMHDLGYDPQDTRHGHTFTRKRGGA